MLDKAKQGKRNRRAGHDFERAFCRWVREELGIQSFGRNLKQYGTAQEGDTDPLAGFLPECKNCVRLNLRDWWRQARAQAERKGLQPLLIYNVARKGWRALIPSPGAGDAPWANDFEFTHDIGPAELAHIIRERL